MTFIILPSYLNFISFQPDKTHTLPIELAALLGHQTRMNMHIIFFMIGVSLMLALGFLGAFWWSMRTGQQDDLYTPSIRILLDDNEPTTSTDATA